MTAPPNNPFMQARSGAIVQLAVFEAVNAIVGDYDPYLGTIAAGASAEEIVMSYPSLELGDVYSVVNYYLHNRTEVDAYLSQREAESARIRKENEKRFPQKGIRARLLARR